MMTHGCTDKRNRLGERLVLCACVCGIGAPVWAQGSPCPPADSPCVLVEGEPMQFRFGVEADWPNSTRIGGSQHVDLSFAYIGCGRFDHFINTDLADPPVDADDAHLYLGTADRITLPTVPPGFGFLGVTGGQQWWRGPQTQFPGQLYLGTRTSRGNAQTSEIAVWNPGVADAGRNVDDRYFEIELVHVDGPSGGDFSAWQDGTSTGVAPWFSTYDPGATANNNRYPDFFGSHAHHNWGATEAGLYELTFIVRTYVRALDIYDLDLNSAIGLGDVQAWIGTPSDVDCDSVTDFFDVADVLDAVEQVRNQ